MNKSEKRDYWFRHCEAAVAAGLSNARYARSHNLKVNRLNYWMRLYRQSLQTPSSFISVEPSVTTKKQLPACVSVAMGSLTLRFDGLPDVEWLTKFVVEAQARL